MLFLKVGDSRVQELCQTRLKFLLVLVDFFTQVFNGVEESMQVERNTIMLPLHILEANVEVRLEKLINSRELRHPRKL